MSIASVADNDMNETEIVAMLETFETVILTGYDSPESAELREQLREKIPTPPREIAEALLPWVEALLKDLRDIAEG